MNDDDTNEDNSQRSHSRTPSINSSSFIVNPNYYSANYSDSSLLNTTSSSESDQNSLLENGQSRFDATEYLLKSVNASLSTLELDKSIVLQSQMSGILNNKSKELITKINELEAFLKNYKAKLQNYETSIIPNLISNLNKNEKKLLKLNKSLGKNYPIEFQKSKDKILNRISNEDDDLYV